MIRYTQPIIAIIIMCCGSTTGMQPPLTFEDRCLLVYDFMQQALEKKRSDHLHQIFPDHPKALVRYVLTGTITTDHEIDRIISDKSFVEDYIAYEKLLEINQSLRNTLGLRLTLNPENTARTVLATYRKMPQHLEILSTIRIYLMRRYRSSYVVPKKVPIPPFKHLAGF